MPVLSATPETVNAVLAAAKPGDTVQLTGAFGAVWLRGRSFSPPLTIDATAATITVPWYWTKVSGLTFKGGTWAGLRVGDAERIVVQDAAFVDMTGEGQTTGLMFDYAKDVSAARLRVSGFAYGVRLTRVDGASVTGSRFEAGRGDGINASVVHGVRIADNVMSAMQPGEGAHADCIQVLSSVGLPPSSDIEVSGNLCVGPSQGIAFFNGPYERVTIRDNRIASIYGNGIGVLDATGLVLEGNRVETLAGALNQSRINVERGVVTSRCGNRVAAFGGRPAAADDMAPAP